MYKLLPADQAAEGLFFRMDTESAERHGSIGYMRADFANSGREFYTTWFDTQPRLKTYDFKSEFDNVINALRDEGQKPPFATRANLAAFCSTNPGKEITGRGWGYMVQTLNYSYYFRCLPRPGDYDVYCFPYDNRYLLPELAGKHELPEFCYSTLPDSGAVIIIKYGESGYYPCDYTTNDRQKNRETADLVNERLEVTKAQEKAMVTGSMFGWTVPGAKPWHYDQNGNPHIKPKDKDHESR